VRLVDGVALDVDASALRSGSNHRIAVVSATAPDEVADPQAFAADSTPIEPVRLHLTVPPGPPGQDEVRLYYISPFAGAYSVAARARITVAPGVPDAVLGRDPDMRCIDARLPVQRVLYPLPQDFVRHGRLLLVRQTHSSANA
jgi:hypothetical protein